MKCVRPAGQQGGPSGAKERHSPPAWTFKRCVDRVSDSRQQAPPPAPDGTAAPTGPAAAAGAVGSGRPAPAQAQPHGAGVTDGGNGPDAEPAAEHVARPGAQAHSPEDCRSASGGAQAKSGERPPADGTAGGGPDERAVGFAVIPPPFRGSGSRQQGVQSSPILVRPQAWRSPMVLRTTLYVSLRNAMVPESKQMIQNVYVHHDEITRVPSHVTRHAALSIFMHSDQRTRHGSHVQVRQRDNSTTLFALFYEHTVQDAASEKVATRGGAEQPPSRAQDDMVRDEGSAQPAAAAHQYQPENDVDEVGRCGTKSTVVAPSRQSTLRFCSISSFFYLLSSATAHFGLAGVSTDAHAGPPAAHGSPWAGSHGACRDRPHASFAAASRAHLHRRHGPPAAQRAAQLATACAQAPCHPGAPAGSRSAEGAPAAEQRPGAAGLRNHAAPAASASQAPPAAGAQRQTYAQRPVGPKQRPRRRTPQSVRWPTV